MSLAVETNPKKECIWPYSNPSLAVICCALRLLNPDFNKIFLCKRIGECPFMKKPSS